MGAPRLQHIPCPEDTGGIPQAIAVVLAHAMERRHTSERMIKVGGRK